MWRSGTIRKHAHSFLNRTEELQIYYESQQTQRSKLVSTVPKIKQQQQKKTEIHSHISRLWTWHSWCLQTDTFRILIFGELCSRDLRGLYSNHCSASTSSVRLKEKKMSIIKIMHRRRNDIVVNKFTKFDNVFPSLVSTTIVTGHIPENDWALS